MASKSKLSQQKKEFRSAITKREEFSLSDKINACIAFLTFLSVLGVVVTIHEMQQDRKATYKPTVLINPIEHEISWNADGEEEWFTNMNLVSQVDTSVDETGKALLHLSLPMAIFPEGKLEVFSAVNIGVGTAENIQFKWAPNNLNVLNDCLITCDPSKAEFLTAIESCIFDFDGRFVVTNPPQNIALMYMLPNATEKYAVELPMAYSILIREIVKSSFFSSVSPLFFLTIDYQDVQGNQYSDIFGIIVHRTYYNGNEDGSGSAKYQLIFQRTE